MRISDWSSDVCSSDLNCRDDCTKASGFLLCVLLRQNAAGGSLMTMTYRNARWLILPVAAMSLSACGINSVPTKEEVAKATWANVQAAYPRRADLSPNPVETAKAAANHEQSTHEGVTQARPSATTRKHRPTPPH